MIAGSMDETVEVKGVVLRTDGLSPESRAYLDRKLNRIRRREKRNRNPFGRLLAALLPADFRRVEVETLVRGKTLVVGCGAGIETLQLGAVGIDVDLSALRVAEDLRAHAASASAKFVAGSGAALPFPDASFDCLLSDNVVEHFPGTMLPPHFREARRVLRPGGWYVFTTPNRLFERTPEEGHESLRSYSEWEAMVLDAGFREVRTPRRRSGQLVDLAWKKRLEAKASPWMQLGLSNRGVRTVTILAYR